MQALRGAPTPKPHLMRADPPPIPAESLRALRCVAWKCLSSGRFGFDEYRAAAFLDADGDRALVGKGFAGVLFDDVGDGTFRAAKRASVAVQGGGFGEIGPVGVRVVAGARGDPVGWPCVFESVAPQIDDGVERRWCVVDRNGALGGGRVPGLRGERDVGIEVDFARDVGEIPHGTLTRREDDVDAGDGKFAVA